VLLMSTEMSADRIAAEGELPEVLGGFDLTDQTRFAAGVPYDLFARLRRERPVLFHPPGTSADGDGFWVLTRHRDISRVLADPVFSAQGGPGRAGGGSHLEDLPMGVHAGVLLAMMDDPRHALIRQGWQPAVHGPAVAGFEPALRGRASALLDAAVGAGGGDFMTDVAEPFALHAIATVLGVPEADRDRIFGWGREVLGFVNRRTGVVDDFSRPRFEAMTRYFAGLVGVKAAAPAADLGSAIATARIPSGAGEPPVSEFERQANLLLMMITGLEQPRNTIAGAVRTFAEHPEQWRALRADRSLLPTAVEEVLRWNPPNPYNRRTAVSDVDIDGELIRAGDKVTLWWPSANRDEAVFAQPSTFDIRRDINPHLSFGAGTHSCMGEEIGRALIALVLSELLDRVESITLTGPVVYAPNNKHTVILRMPVELR
jgi:cytochrome P450